MCRVECTVSLTEGVWGQEQWVRRGVNRAVVPIATNQEGKGAPQRVVGRSPAAFSRNGQNDREAGVLPIPVLPSTPPMDEVHGIISIRFAGVLVCCLCFHFFT